MSARAFVRQWLGRTLLLLLWSLVAWGGLLLLLTLFEAAGEGLRPAFGRIVPSGGASIWAWVNALSVALALVAGLVGAGLFAWARRLRDATGAGLDKTIAK